MTTEHVPDHAARAVELLPQQHKGKATIEALLAALVGPVQAVEDALWALLVERGVDTAVGVVLDAIGTIVGQERGGMGDEDYRRFVRARITVNKSRGLANELVLVTNLVLDDPAVTIVLEPQYPAAIVVRIIGATISAIAAETLASFLRRTVAAGVRLFVEFQTADDANTFAFLDYPDGLGFGDSTDPAVGGIFASVIE